MYTLEEKRLNSERFLKNSRSLIIMILLLQMCKKNFVTLAVKSKHYKLHIDDMQAVHTAIRKKRPQVPSY